MTEYVFTIVLIVSMVINLWSTLGGLYVYTTFNPSSLPWTILVIRVKASCFHCCLWSTPPDCSLKRVHCLEPFTKLVSDLVGSIFVFGLLQLHCSVLHIPRNSYQSRWFLLLSVVYYNLTGPNDYTTFVSDALPWTLQIIFV